MFRAEIDGKGMTGPERRALTAELDSKVLQQMLAGRRRRVPRWVILEGVRAVAECLNALPRRQHPSAASKLVEPAALLAVARLGRLAAVHVGKAIDSKPRTWAQESARNRAELTAVAKRIRRAVEHVAGAR